jgi:hypothetical protein
MRQRRWFQLALISMLGTAGLALWSQPALAQGKAQATPPKCNVLHAEMPLPDKGPTSSDPKNLRQVTADLLNSGLPCDAPNTGNGPETTQVTNRQRGFDFYSWLTFIALNSPSVKPGAPSAKPGGIASSRPDTKALWEDGTMFKPLLDVMLPNSQVPEWTKTVIPPACQKLHAEHPERMVVKMIEESFNEPFKTGALIDQHGDYAIFDILMNRQMFDYIVAHKLYSKALQASDENAALRVDFPSGHQDDTGAGDVGAIMLKVSWKILTDGDDKNKFHHVEALVQMPKVEGQPGSPPCVERVLGLVGMHIVHKTVTRPQWIWSSFEHADNVPEIGEIRSGKPLKASYNFFNSSCVDEKKCNFNATPPRPWDPEYADFLQFHKSPDGHQFHSQIVRMVDLTPATNDINKKFQAILAGTVWKNYIMIGTQWPSSFPCTGDHAEGAPAPSTDFDKQPDMNCAPAPTFLANSTLETFSQGEVPQASSSCMACHGNATSYLRRDVKAANDPKQKFMNQSDFTFMLEKAQ